MKLTVLVVDDELLLREVIKDYLEKRNINVLDAENGSQALEIATENQIDFAIVDIKMPGMSGFFLIEKLQKIFPNLPIAIITAFPSLEGVEKSKRMGVREFVVKPFQLDKIYELIIKEDVNPPKKNANKKGNVEISHPSENPSKQAIRRPLDASRKHNIYKNIDFYYRESELHKKKTDADNLKKLDQLFKNGDLTLEEFNKRKRLLNKKYGK